MTRLMTRIRKCDWIDMLHAHMICPVDLSCSATDEVPMSVAANRWMNRVPAGLLGFPRTGVRSRASDATTPKPRLWPAARPAQGAKRMTETYIATARDKRFSMVVAFGTESVQP